MAEVGLETIAGLLDGHIDLRRRADSVQPLRYPSPEAPFYDPFTRWVASTPAGVRLRFRTDSRSVRLAVNQRLLAGEPGVEPRGAYDLLVDGQPWGRAVAAGGLVLQPDFTGVGDEQAVVTFDGLPAGDKGLELWLPQAATVSVRGLQLDAGAGATPWPDGRRTILFHGSSISHCMEATGAAAGWPAVASGLADLRHINLGWAGSCLLSGLAARVIRDQAADAIVLKLGINVWNEGQLKERTFLDSAHAMLSIIREKHPATPICVISPIFSPGREAEGDGGGLPLVRMRELLAQVVKTRQAVGDGHIRYLSGLELFGESDAHDLPDDLHPNTAGYRRMGERFHALMLSGEGALI
ncbi:GDSL-type esterase/lipase family protein [Caulobacter sp. KR2-114]|uniref:GDSL-type esterase/lipase family protein n=1 Tax=Caulobacter sp. KR2-114 TaxID=3400912 RepID=UPI003C0A42FA